ncbi:cryptochrome/photolyase family protein [Oricola cellulosilytica]|uniref:Deoxyribodipyrimidine photo-lyase n=1 Tax=Oricola cellulosilytica TaxID=1429082 RepID=A0A4R0P720_9HYPH|nr:deoxyribodipyrimidine photo-lyase [Oricola cellulosilytica]
MPAGEPRHAPIIVWFRNDLRTGDNRALSTGSRTGVPVIPLYILEDEEDGSATLGSAQKWWLHHSIEALASRLASMGTPLILRRGRALEVLHSVVSVTGARTVLWNRRYLPSHLARDAEIQQALQIDGVTIESSEGHILHEPTQMRTVSGGPYRVYTPFWRAFSSGMEPRPPLARPESLMPIGMSLQSDRLEDWGLLPNGPDWSAGIAAQWTPGEDGAITRLDAFLAKRLAGYGEDRNVPSIDGTSRLSPHLAFGEITPFQIWHATEMSRDEVPTADLQTFRKELVWREFSYHLLVNCPDLPTANYNSDFDKFPWREPGDLLSAWQRGRTGYPIVDAGMRQLWQTGWMHNRVRMIVGSFLVKHLLIDWRHGEKWFWDTLVDADPASNSASWQWIAGSGADASPYFRIFNPILQGEKFDPTGEYVKQFVPELADIPAKYIHNPWEAPASVQSEAGVRLGETYPRPIVEHRRARERALNAYHAMKGKTA